MTMKKVNGQSLNPQEELIKQLKKNFPEVFSEDGKVDPEKLKLTLGEDIELSREKYGLSWAGKSDCFREIQKTTTATLIPQKDESVNFDKTENIFIEGENLETLRVLQRSYYGRVKMIYIDPPYNTGNDFVYNDSFKQDKKEYLEQIGETNGNGELTKDSALRKNTKDNGHYHSDWLNMMYPRLFLAKNLLMREGIIFVSIDDNEVYNLRMVMNEIFGEENFIAQLVWKSRQNKDNRNITNVSVDHEYVLCYGRKLRGGDRDVSQYSNPDNDPRGDWTSANMVGLLPEDERPNCHYDLVDPKTGINYGKPDLGWRYDKNTMEKLIKEKRILFPDDPGGRPRRKVFLSELSSDYTGYSSMIGKGIYTRDGTQELEELFGKKRLLDFPKPVNLIKELIKQAATRDGDIVMDFFAGSATTAHSLMRLNQEDGINRKYILVQLDESTDEDSDANKEGYKTIADIAKERIRRAGDKLTDGGKQLGLSEDGNRKLDIGFKAFKLTSSNFKEWNTEIKTEEELQQQLEAFVSNGIGDATDMAQIYELLLKNGYDLNSKVEAKEIKDKKVYLVNGGELVICLEGVLERDIVDEIVKLEPAKVIFLETCFNNDDELKTNTLLQMESADIDFRVV